MPHTLWTRCVRGSLLSIRDMMCRGFKRFQNVPDAGEGISTNILSDRLS
jgi:hypothetical protein